VFLCDINSSKIVARTWKVVMKEMILQDLIEQMKMLKSAESGAFK
jgi:hypothetical protein